MTAPRVPLAVGLVVAIAILLAAARLAPELVEALVALLVLYLAVTNADRVTELFAAAPRALEALFPPPVAGGPQGHR
jgi:hypothetical protein